MCFSSESPARNENSNSHILKKAITEDVGFFDKLENRFREHLKGFTEKPATVYCKFCNVEVPKLIVSVKDHIFTSNHISLSKIPIMKTRYICGICKHLFTNEKKWTAHLNNKQHNENVKKHSETTKDDIVEYECSCGTVTFGDKASVANHKKSSQKKIQRELNVIKRVV